MKVNFQRSGIHLSPSFAETWSNVRLRRYEVLANVVQQGLILQQSHTP